MDQTQLSFVVCCSPVAIAVLLIVLFFRWTDRLQEKKLAEKAERWAEFDRHHGSS